MTPDRASVLFTIQTRSATAATAGSENARRTQLVLDALLKLGLSREQLFTEGYSLFPEARSDAPGAPQRVVGYVANNSLRVESRKTEQAGQIIDAALGAGANAVGGLTFYASSIEDARRTAISAAVASAKSDAEAIARAAGGAVGSLLEVSTNGPTSTPRPLFDLMRGRSLAGEPTPIVPGPQIVTVFVSIRWNFLPAH